MHHHRRANRIRGCKIQTRAERPGIIKSFMMPTKLRNQIKTGSPETKLKFTPAGKTLVGGVQWAIKIQRPGLARPLIVAKKEQQAMAKLARAAKKVGAVDIDREAAKGAVDAAAIAKAKAIALSGWRF